MNLTLGIILSFYEQHKYIVYREKEHIISGSEIILIWEIWTKRSMFFLTISIFRFKTRLLQISHKRTSKVWSSNQISAKCDLLDYREISCLPIYKLNGSNFSFHVGAGRDPTGCEQAHRILSLIRKIILLLQSFRVISEFPRT